MDHTKFPRVPKDLLEALDKAYPERCPDIDWSDRQVWVRVGERAVVRFLKQMFEDQNEDPLSPREDILD